MLVDACKNALHCVCRLPRATSPTIDGFFAPDCDDLPSECNQNQWIVFRRLARRQTANHAPSACGAAAWRSHEKANWPV